LAKTDPPSPQLLELLHYAEDLSNYIHSKPKTTSDAARLLWFHIRRLRGVEVEWPLPQPGGLPGVTPPLLEVAGVTSIRADAAVPLTGDVVLASGTNISLSEAGQTITINVVPGIPASHGCRVRNSGNELLTTGVVAELTFDSERYDTDAYHSTAVNTTRLTVPAGLDGIYSLAGAVEFAANATGVRLLRIRLNGATIIANIVQNAAGGGNTTPITIATLYQLAVGDFVELQAFQTSGGNLNVLATGNYSPEFAMQLVGR